MFILDTNVVSAVMDPDSDPSVATWFAGRDPEDLILTAVSQWELLLGIPIMPRGNRHIQLESSLTRWLNLGF